MDLYKKPPTLHVPALVALATSLGGLVLSPAFLAVIPAKWAATIIAAGAFVQAFTRAIHDGTPKETL